MRLSRICTRQPLAAGQVIELAPDKAHYLGHVLRLRVGQSVALFNGEDAADFDARIDVIGKNSARLTILERHPRDLDPTIEITLIQAVGRFDSLDLIMQKATELGIGDILLFNAERTQHPLKSNRIDRKLAHWAAIIESACEQCGRNTLPGIEFVRDLAHCLPALAAANRLLLDFSGGSLADFSPANPAQALQFLVGPEGGLSDRERDMCLAHGFTGCSLGPRVLRMETAAISALGLIQSRFGDM